MIRDMALEGWVRRGDGGDMKPETWAPGNSWPSLHFCTPWSHAHVQSWAEAEGGTGFPFSEVSQQANQVDTCTVWGSFLESEDRWID